MFKKRKKKQIECSAESKEALMGIKRKAAVTAAQRLTLEKEMLLSGKKPKSIFSSAQQRTAVRLLSGFFAMMLIFTILSRIATDLTIAKVRTDTVKPGVLVQSYTIPGTLEARDTLDIVLPGNLRISNRMVQAGDRVKAGDEVLTLDLDYVRAATEQLENEIDILNLKIGNLSNEVPSADTKMLQLAENNLRYAQADYVQLVAALEASGIQVEQDLKEAQNRYHQELNDLEKAKVQAKEEGIETAENGLDAAQKALGDAQYSRDEAVSAARKSLSEAESVYSSAPVSVQPGNLLRRSRRFRRQKRLLNPLERALLMKNAPPPRSG